MEGKIVWDSNPKKLLDKLVEIIKKDKENNNHHKAFYLKNKNYKMDFLSSSFNLELVLRLVLAVIFGGLIGLEREFAKKTAGLKTFALVSLGSSLFTIISILVFQFVSDIVPKNPLQLVTIPAAAVSGIGFIGAGLIIFHGSHVRGLQPRPDFGYRRQLAWQSVLVFMKLRGSPLF